MMVLPNTLWKGGSSQAKVQVVVRVADGGPLDEDGRDPTHRLGGASRDQSRSFQTRVLGSVATFGITRESPLGGPRYTANPNTLWISRV